MKRFLAAGAAALIIGGLAALNMSGIGRIYLPSGTGILAKQLCSMVFVSGLDQDYAKSAYLDPLLGDADNLITLRVNEDSQEVAASVFGLFWSQRAVHREGLGCTLVHSPAQFDFDLEAPLDTGFQAMTLNTAARDATFDQGALDAALDQAFADPTGQRQTLGVVVLHDGALVAERYAPQASRETRFIGWSMTKSVTSLLAGVLLEDGRIDLDAAGSVPALNAQDRADITLDNLLRMNAGLALREGNDGTDPTSEMLFTQSDMARYAARAERLHAPGDHWEYMSGSTNLAMSGLQAEIGGDLLDQVAFMRRELFEPAGVYSAVMEPDATGMLVGSSYMYATAQDWARLAQLSLDNGVANGERILPDNWYELISLPTTHSAGEYGLAFWLPGETSDLPEDTAMMIGFQGQWAYILPEQDLVIVRFGATNGVSAETDQLALDVIGALR